MLFQSIVVYSFCTLLMFVFAKSIPINFQSQDYHRPWSLPKNCWFCILLFALLSGLRYDVGVDHLQYLNYYLDALHGLDVERVRGIEEGYLFITKLFARLDIHPIIYFAVWGALQLYFITLVCRLNRDVLPYLMLVVISGGYFFTWMNGMRQMLVACSFVWAVKFIYEKKIHYYCIWLLLAYTFHHSVIILFPLFLLAYNKTKWDNRWICFILLIGSIVLGNIPFWINRISGLTNLLSMIGYEYYADTFDSIIDSGSFHTFNLGPRMICNVVTYSMCIYYYPEVSKRYSDSYVDIIYKMFMIGICGYYLFINTNLMFIRPMLYFTVFALPVTAYSLAYLHENKDHKLFAFVLLIIASMSYVYFCCLSDASTPIGLRKSYLYQFYFDNM